MEILGIGPLELFFILIIALIVLGPNDMVKAGRTLGRLMRSIVTSSTWQMIQQTSREFRYLPNRLMREAGMEELKESLPKSKELSKQMGLDDLNKDMKTWQKDLSDWTTTPSPTIGTPPEPLESSDQESAVEMSAGLDEDNETQETPKETTTESE
jgi:Sec-independent protein translocase protein TatA